MNTKLLAMKEWIVTHKLLTAALLIIAGFVGVQVFGSNGSDVPTYTVSKDTLSVDGITVSGKVTAREEVDLGFETSGRIAVVAAKEGERVAQGAVIARLDASDIAADLQAAQADVAAEVAKLNELRETEGGLSKSETAREDVVQAMRIAYTKADDAVYNSVDQFYTDLDTAYPEIIFIFDDNALRQELNTTRRTIEKTFEEWRALDATLTATSYTSEDLSRVKTYLASVRTFIERVAIAVNRFEPNDTYSQSAVDKFRSDIAQARTNLNTAQSELLASEEGLRGTTSQIPFQEARVASMRAAVKSLEARLAKSAIVAPFSGVVTVQDAKVGMIASANTPVMSLISDSEFQVEAFVPEIYTSNLVLGARSSIALDAYNDDTTFQAYLAYIDPAATERDGVATYKVKLAFDTNDERIKSGMTASVTIETDSPTDTVKVPALGITERDGMYYVKVKNGDAVELRKVTIGQRTDDVVEVTSGLIVGEVIVLAEQQ